MGVFDGEQQDALDLITEFGEAATLRVFSEARDPDKEWEADEPTEEELTARMVFLNFSEQGNSGNVGERYWNGSLIHQGDKKVLLAAKGLAFAPNINAQVVRADGSVWKVINIKSLDPNGQQILYTMQVRQ